MIYLGEIKMSLLQTINKVYVIMCKEESYNDETYEFAEDDGGKVNAIYKSREIAQKITDDLNKKWINNEFASEFEGRGNWWVENAIKDNSLDEDYNQREGKPLERFFVDLQSIFGKKNILNADQWHIFKFAKNFKPHNITNEQLDLLFNLFKSDGKRLKYYVVESEVQ